MWTINITPIPADLISVRVLRWGREGRYPAQLAEFVADWRSDEPELAMVDRCLRLAGAVLDARRAELQLPW